MNDQPTIGPPSSDPGAAATRDPAQISAPTAPLMPDLSMAPGSSASGKPAAPQPPKLDGYDVINSIGEGGMGTVWRAVQLSTRRNVALKLISAAGFASDRARQRFDREVEITARLEHPNIARVYDSGINRGVYFYAMELIDGVPLDQYVSSHHLSRPDILRLFAIVCRAVDHAHQRGVIHRDLKPGNILVSPDGQPHVLDFGLAKALEQAGKEAGLSIDGDVAGTPGFMSPEQAAGKLDLDPRCDVYSLGVILYRLLTGQTPHDLSGTYFDILRRLNEEEPKRPRAADRTMDRELEALLLHALERDPLQRYKSAGELAQDIENYVNGDPISAKPPTLAYFVRKRAQKHRVKIVTAGIVAVLLSLATLLTVRLIRAHRAAIFEAKQEELQKQQTQIARGKGSVLDGDKAVDTGKFADANSLYLGAIEQFKMAGVPAAPAELGLWNLARTAPPPLITIPPLHAGLSDKFATAGALAILADNRRALAGYDDGAVRLFDMPTGRLLKTIAAEKNAVRSLAASADGTLALTGGDAGSLKLWDLATGALKMEFRNPAAPLRNRVTHVALSPDGHYALSISGATPEVLASPAYNDTVTLWDIAGGRALLTTDRETKVFDVNQTVTAASFSPDSSMVVTAGAQVVAWKARDGKQVSAVPDSAMAAAFSPYDGEVVAGSSDGTVRILFVPGRRVDPVLQGNGAVQAIGFHRRDDQIITITEDGAFHAIDLPEPAPSTVVLGLRGKELWTQPPHGEPDCVALSPDASLALTAGESGLSVWRMSQPPEMRDIATGESFPNTAISDDGRLVLARSARNPGRCLLFDSSTRKVVSPANFPASPCNGIALSRDGRTLANVAGSVLEVWSLDPPHEVRHFRFGPTRSSNQAVAVAISSNGAKVAVGAADHSLSLHRLQGSSEGQKLTGHSAAITSASFSADGRMLLTGSEDETARLWDADSGATIAALPGNAAPVNAVAVSKDGKFAVTASGAVMFQEDRHNSIRTWELPSGKPLGDLRIDSDRVNAVAISGDGQLIASASDNGGITLWDRASGQALRTIRSSHGPVLSLALDERGQFLVCGCREGLSLCDLHRPVEQRELEPAVVAVRSKDASNPLTPGDYLALGRWYAFQDEPAWGSAFFRQAEAGGVAVPALERWRCDWERGDLAAAERDIKLISAQDAPAFYVKLCAEAMRLEKEHR